jgi:hypothetical protein
MTERDRRDHGMMRSVSGALGSGYVLTRVDLRGTPEMRQKQAILFVTPLRVAENQTRKALGGGTPAVHHAS